MAPRRGSRGLYLSESHDLGQLVAVRCHFCRSPWRLYEPLEMIRLLGDHEVDSLTRRLRCERCNRSDYMDVTKRWREDAIRDGAHVRRLVTVKTVRRPIWREEPLQR